MATDWTAYEIAVRKLEDQGLTTSDAQAVVDAEMLQNPTLHMLVTGDNGFPKQEKPKKYRCRPVEGGEDTCQHKNCPNNASWRVESGTPDNREVTWLCNSHKDQLTKTPA